MEGCGSTRTCSCGCSNQLKCDQCGQSFQYDPDCVAELGQHSIKNHCVNRIGHFAQANENSTENTVQWISNAKVNVKCLKHDDYDQYKTTVESWRDGPTDLRCCQCGYAGPPYIRRQKHKVAYSRLGNYLLMACWPLCFVPISSRNEITLYCRKCGSFFGCYDLDSGNLVSSCYSSHISLHSKKNCGV